MKMRTCKTCKFWDQRYKENQKLGVCLRFGAIRYGNDISLSIAIPGTKPISDYEAVRTTEQFGCCFHSDYIKNGAV